MAEEEKSVSDSSSNYGLSVADSASKIAQLDSIASGGVTSYDSSSIKGKMALFLLAHADKVMDTVAPLETLRDELVDKYTETVQERMEDPELTPGQVSKMIADIQNMNMYSFNMLKSILDADKLQTLVNIDMSSNKTINTQVNDLSLDSAASRARVARALDLIYRLEEVNNSENADSSTTKEG